MNNNAKAATRISTIINISLDNSLPLLSCKFALGKLERFEGHRALTWHRLSGLAIHLLLMYRVPELIFSRTTAMTTCASASSR